MKNNMFNDILDDGEEIIKVIKPSGKRYLLSMLMGCLLFLFYAVFLVACFSIGDIEDIAEVRLILWSCIGVGILTLIIVFLFSAIAYKNWYCAYTTKRLIIRKGIIGIDFQSLEYKSVTSTSVKVGLLDKITKTGTISFFSPSSPMMYAGNMAMVGFKFGYIKNPYQTMKDIQVIINKINSEKKD